MLDKKVLIFFLHFIDSEPGVSYVTISVVGDLGFHSITVVLSV